MALIYSSVHCCKRPLAPQLHIYPLPADRVGALYVFANDSKPIGFTSAHSAYIPVWAQTAGFGVWGASDGGGGGRGAGQGPEEHWRAYPVAEGTAPPNAWEIYWNDIGRGRRGALGPECVPMLLRVGMAC